MFDDFFQAVQVGHRKVYFPGKGCCGFFAQAQDISYLHLFRGDREQHEQPVPGRGHDDDFLGFADPGATGLR